MVNYSAAFKLPFTSLNRSAALFFIAAVASLANVSYSITSEMLKNDAGRYSGQAIWLNLSAGLISFGIGLFFSVVLSGYSIRIAANAMRGKNEMPPFDNVPSLIGAGFKYMAALIAYTLPLLLIITLMALSAVAKPAVLLLSALVIFAAFLWLFFICYCGPMLLAHFARENRFAAFFELGKILKYSFTPAYFIPWLAAFGYSIGIGIPYIIIVILISFLSMISPLAMLLLVPFGALFTLILTPTVASLYGQAYREVIGGKAIATAAAPVRVKPKAAKGKSKK